MKIVARIERLAGFQFRFDGKTFDTLVVTVPKANDTATFRARLDDEGKRLVKRLEATGRTTHLLDALDATIKSVDQAGGAARLYRWRLSRTARRRRSQARSEALTELSQMHLSWQSGTFVPSGLRPAVIVWIGKTVILLPSPGR